MKPAVRSLLLALALAGGPGVRAQAPAGVFEIGTSNLFEALRQRRGGRSS